MSTKKTTTTITKFDVNLTNDFFPAHARQQLSAQLALFELLDNALCNPKPGQTANIALAIVPEDKNLVRFVVADWGRGMNSEELVNALQFGSTHKDEGYLCIYGVGLGNALLSLSQHKYDWTIASKKSGEAEYHTVVGPFSLKMEMADLTDAPCAEYVTKKDMEQFGEPSTIISVVTDYYTASTMLSCSGKPAPSKVTSLNILRRSMAEHIGVRYSKALLSRNGKPAMRVMIPDYTIQSGETRDVFVDAIEQSYVEHNTVRDSVDIGGHKISFTLTEGILNKDELANAVTGGYTENKEDSSINYFAGNVVSVFPPKSEGQPLTVGIRATVYDPDMKKYESKLIDLKAWNGEKAKRADWIAKMRLEPGAYISGVCGTLTERTTKKGTTVLQASLFRLRYSGTFEITDGDKQYMLLSGNVGTVDERDREIRASLAVDGYDREKQERVTTWYNLHFEDAAMNKLKKAGGVKKGDRITVLAQEIDLGKETKNPVVKVLRFDVSSKPQEA